MVEINSQMAQKIAQEVSLRMERSKVDIPVGVSNRHVHLTQEHWDILFGKGTPVRKLKQLRQPGFFAAYETVSVEGPKGKLDGLRMVGPYRSKTQVELAQTDAITLGLRPPIRESGKLEGSAPIRVIGPKGSVDLKEGAIIALRHIHYHPDEANAMGVKNGELVRVRLGGNGERETVYEHVVIRVSDQFKLELHLDTDEAYAAGVKSGDVCHIA